MADRVINLEDTTIIGDVPMTRKNAIMSQKTTPAPTMTMADVAEDFIPAEYQYLRDLSPEEQSRELLKLQDKWMNEAVSKPVKRKKDDYKGVKSVLMNDASGKSVVVPVEDIPDFERRKATEENLKKLELANAPWELLMGLGGLAAAGPPIVKGKAGSRLSVSPRTAAAITALSTAVPKKAEAMPTYLVKGAVEENQVKLDALKKGPLFMDPKLVQERIEQGGRDTLSFITPEGKQTGWTMVNSPGRSRGSAISRRYQDIMDSSFGNKRISMARQLYSDPEVRAFLEEEGLSLPDINAPTSGSQRQGTLVSQTKGQRQDTAEAGRQRWIEAGIEGYKRLQEAFRRKMKKGE